MRARSKLWLAIPCLTALAAAPLSAQQSSSPRSGFGLALGLGRGSAGVACGECGIDSFDPENRTEGLSGYVRLGGYATSNLFVGIEGTGWMKNEESLERRIAAASVVFVAYPSSAGFFVRGGFGGMRAVIEDDVAALVGEGLVWSAGIGFDIPLGGAALTPYATYLSAVETSTTLNEIAVDAVINPNIVQVGLALTVH